MAKIISAEQIEKQLYICDRIKDKTGGFSGLAFVDTYGCQQNEADSEKLRGFLERMGYGFTRDEDKADVVVINTCAIREHAEMRVLGNVGALTHTKRRNKEQIIALCGCMVQQDAMTEKIKRSFRHVDLVFGPHALWRFPELMERILTERGRVFEIDDTGGEIAEGMPQTRDGSVKAWLSVMYGCNNFCSYCIVPYVRGRERSRQPEDILREARELVDRGYKDITLLGQNVNSYGRDTGSGTDFPKLLRLINDIPGDFRIRFMTSHPKDATAELYDAMAQCGKCAKHIHLPMQSGSARVLQAMNRRYTPEDYLKLVEEARSRMPEIVLTSDIIVGFPGETLDEFNETLEMLKTVGFHALFTFLYSRREGTPAAEMPDNCTKEEKQRRFEQLIQVQNGISEALHSRYVGQTMRVLVDGTSADTRYNLEARTDGGRLVHMSGPESLVGSFTDVKINSSRTWALYS